MDVYEAIQNRHSVRAYTDEAVDEATLRRVLDAGRIAPSARNRQDWMFVVVRDAATQAKLVAACGQGWMSQAPVIVAVVSTAPRTMHCEIPAGPVDCSIAIDHMTLAAVAEGLGTCWIGHFDQGACCEILAVPETCEIIELMTLGHPAAPAPADKPRKAFDDVVRWDIFS